MLKNWSKIVLVSVLVLMVTASLSFATTARVRSLAHTGDYLTDDSNAQRWYSVLPMYANQVNAEVGTWGFGSLSDTRGLAWTIACGEDAKWGTYRIALNENALDHPGFYSASPFYMMHLPGWGLSGLMSFYDDPFTGMPTPLNLADTPINKFDLAGGWELGDNFLLGVSITHSGWKYDYTDTLATEDTKGSMFTFGVGGTWTNNEDVTIDGSLTIAMSSVEGTLSEELSAAPLIEANGDLQDDHSMAFDFATRLFWDWTDNTQIVPMFEFSKSEYDVTYSETIDSPGGESLNELYINGKDTYFKLGLGLNVDVNSGNTLIFAAEFANYEFEQLAEETNIPDTSSPPAEPTDTDIDRTVTFTYLPTLRLALESEITPWMTTRIGASKMIGKVKEENRVGGAGGEFEEEITPGTPLVIDGGFGNYFLGQYDNGFDWNLGVGFNVAEWTIDMELADETPFSLGYWLTGYSAWSDGSIGPVYRISAVYNY
jgi:hypothetical protein